MGDATGTTSFPGFARCVEFIRSGNAAVMEDGFWWLFERAAEFTSELIELVTTEPDRRAREMFVELLGATHDVRAVPVLAADLPQHDQARREQAIAALEELGLPEADAVLARHARA